ncbi:hypothetical protein K493DRAFT_301984 [Basidiobolus meristosporus CBS 931.73]|uniref:Uncharacterized protein n=1 Tax=Basidiobolus meristosporus CBS 931.73 TaxID=1314790 RepID=A0A1Y1Y983_9FUNG|nr:hypothetical protein K493DRAFT_301984 [Basidiobolus meristosporus CBS 931.73]|eukprot:ORX94582.1 hypothetical protein K493DRAFT_301984 [Basidiobolus meristosporus CBS 931.73]
MTNPRKPVKEWLDITNDEGLWSVKLDHSSGIFPEYFKRPKNTTVVRNYRFLVTVKDDLTEGRQKGPIFNIEDPPPPEEVNPTSANALHFAIPIANHSLLLHPSKINQSATAAVSASPTGATSTAAYPTNEPKKTSNIELIHTNSILNARPDQSSPFDLSLNTVIGITASVLAGLILLIGYPLHTVLNPTSNYPKSLALTPQHSNLLPLRKWNQKNGKYTMAESAQQRNTCDFSRYSVSGYTSTDAFLPVNEPEHQEAVFDTANQPSPCILAALPSSLVSDSHLSPTDERSKPMSLCLTVKDAQLIADTYRRLLRKPSWNEDDIKEFGKRNTYTDELMRRELEAEGKGVKHVNTAPTLVVVNEEQKVDRRSMMSIRELEELPNS